MTPIPESTSPGQRASDVPAIRLRHNGRRHGLKLSILLLLSALAALLPTSNADAIYNGYTANIAAFPFFVRVKTTTGSCGGTLVRADVVLTAAHCVENATAAMVTVSFAAQPASPVGLRLNPIIPTNYVHSQAAGYPNDAALLLLNQKRSEPIVGLSPSGVEPPVGTWTTTVGFGRTAQPKQGVKTCPLTNLPTQLQAAAEQIVAFSKCNGGDVIASSDLCTDGGGASAWHGDSGGPLLQQQTNGAWTQVGITSQSVTYAAPYKNAFTSVAQMRNWINNKLATNPFPSPPVNRNAITSYNRMQPGAPHNGYFVSAWQAFTAASNRLTYLGVTVGNVTLPAGVQVPWSVTVRLCTSPSCATVLVERSVPIVNFGNSAADIGDVPTVPGTTYYVVWYQPATANGTRWLSYWWSGGTSIATSDQMQTIVQGYNA